jgi:hypothetical protein
MLLKWDGAGERMVKHEIIAQVTQYKISYETQAQRRYGPERFSCI